MDWLECMNSTPRRRPEPRRGMFGFRQLGGDLGPASVAEGLSCDLTPAATGSRLADVTQPGMLFDLCGPWIAGRRHRNVVKGPAGNSRSDYQISAKVAETTADMFPGVLVAGCERGLLEETALGGGVPHQPRVEGFGGEHGQDHDGAEGQGANPGLDRDHRAEGDQ